VVVAAHILGRKKSQLTSRSAGYIQYRGLPTYMVAQCLQGE